METLNNPVFWGIACLICLWINLWASTRIIGFLNAKGQKASLFKDGFFIKGRIFSFLPQYGKLAKREGRKAYLLPVFWLSFALAFVAFFVGIFLLV